MSAPPRSPPSRGLASLPWRLRLYIAAVVAASALPALLAFYAALTPREDPAAALGRRPLVATALSATVLVALCVALERPRHWALRPYLAQLRAHLLALHPQHPPALARPSKEQTS